MFSYENLKIRVFFPPLCAQVDVADAAKTAEAFLKITSVYKEENNDVKNAVLESVGETLGLHVLMC